MPETTKGPFAAAWARLEANDPSFDCSSMVELLKECVVVGSVTADDAARVSVTLLQSSSPGAAEAGRSLLRVLAADGNASAMLNLAVSLIAGHGGPADPSEACTLLERLAERTELEDIVRGGALAQLAQCYRDGVGATADQERAVGLYERAAVLGATSAAYSAGLICQGEGGKHQLPAGPDYQRAARCYALAPEDMQCLTNLGLLHLRALAQNSDMAKGLELVRDAAQMGDAYALQVLASYSSIGRYAEEMVEGLAKSRGGSHSRASRRRCR